MHVASPGTFHGPKGLPRPSHCNVYLIPDPQWIDLRVAVGADITIEFYVDGVCFGVQF
jgi:hypothetical protein